MGAVSKWWCHEPEEGSWAVAWFPASDVDGAAVTCPAGGGVTGAGVAGTGLTGTGLTGAGVAVAGLVGAVVPGAGLVGAGAAGATVTAAGRVVTLTLATCASTYFWADSLLSWSRILACTSASG